MVAWVGSGYDSFLTIPRPLVQITPGVAVCSVVARVRNEGTLLEVSVCTVYWVLAFLRERVPSVKS